MALQRTGKFKEALKIYEKLLEKRIVDYNLYNLTALTYKALGEFERGLKLSKEANEITNYSSAILLDTYGTLLKDLERYQRS